MTEISERKESESQKLKKTATLNSEMKKTTSVTNIFKTQFINKLRTNPYFPKDKEPPIIMMPKKPLASRRYINADSVKKNINLMDINMQEYELSAIMEKRKISRKLPANSNHEMSLSKDEKSMFLKGVSSFTKKL